MKQNNHYFSYIWLISGCLLLNACVADKKNSSVVYDAPTKLRGQTKKESQREAVQIKTELAIAYMTGGNYRAATQTIEEVLQKDNQYDIAWLVRAQIYQYLKVIDKAEESFKQALKLNPNGAEINNNYGWFLCHDMNRAHDAIAYFDKAIADPTYPTPEVAYFNKGICHAQMQQFNLADSNFERALQMNSQFVPVYKERARAFMLAENFKEADRLFRQYQSMVDVLSADDLLLGWKLAKHQGLTQPAFEYEAQLRQNYPYSNELKSITTGQFNKEFVNAPNREMEETQ